MSEIQQIPAPQSNPPSWQTLAGLTIAYFIAGKLGLKLAFVNASASAVWPPAGLALAALLLFGYRLWPAILIGAFLVNATTAGSIATSITIAVGNTLEAYVGASLVNRFANGKNVLDRPQDVFRFALLCGLLSPAFSALVGLTGLSVGGYAPWKDFGSILVTWWSGDAIGNFVIAPLLLSWAKSSRIKWNFARSVEAAALTLALILVCLLVFTGKAFHGKHYPLEFVCIPVFIWAAFRFGRREAVTATAVLSAIAIAGTLNGHGPFVQASANASLLLLQLYMGIIMIMTLTIAAFVAQQKKIEMALEESCGQLEVRVSARSASLSQTIEKLKSEMADNKRMQRALVQMAAVVDSSDDGIFGKSLDGVVLNWNRGAEKTYGYLANEIVGQPIEMVCPPEKRGELQQLMARVRSGEHIFHHETERIRKDGTRIHVALTLAPIVDSNGRVTGISTVSRDITDRIALVREQEARRRAEGVGQQAEFLAQATAFLLSSLDYQDTLNRVLRLGVSRLSDWCVIYLVGDDTVPSSVVTAHVNTADEELARNVLTAAGPGYEDMIAKLWQGRKSELMADVNDQTLLGIGFAPSHLETFRKLAIRSAIFTPLMVRGRMLGVLLFASSSRRYGIEDLLLADELTLCSGIAIDNARLYTEMVQSREALREGQESLNIAVDAAQMGDWDLDIVRDVSRRSLRHDQIFGYDTLQSEWGWKRFIENHVLPEDREETVKKFGDAAKSHGRFSWESRIITAKKEIRWILVTGRVYRDAQDQPVRMAGVVADVTERKQLEEQMMKARDAAVESAQLKSEFVANVSHEIRTPMNAIVGMAGLLMDSKLTPRQRDFVQTMKDSSDSLLTIINDILDFSKIEAGKMPLEETDFSINDCVQSAVDLLEPRAQAKGLEVVNSIEESVPDRLRGDSTRLRQILLNLIGNAIKFTERGAVMVRVRKESESDSHIKVRLSISDTGIGISPDQQRRLFRPFVQGDNSTSRKYGGTGLGLAISNRLADLMGGQIEVDSAPGQGSTFWCTLRFEKAPLAFPVPAKISPTIAKTNGHPTAPKKRRTPKKTKHRKDLRILVAEDSSVNQKVIRLQLQQLGYDADIVGNGLEALEAVERVPYDLVLMDCQMPEMDGYEATVSLRQREKNGRHIPIIAMTANAMKGDREKCLASGMEDYIAKPVTPEKLEEALAKWSFAQELTELFIQQTTRNLREMRDALLAKNAVDLRRAAHTIKGSSSHLHLDTITSLAARTEALAEQKNFREAEQRAEELENTFAQFRETWQRKENRYENHTHRR